MTATTSIRRRRWSDNDHHFGPFTYARDAYGKPLGIVLDSGEEESPGCHLRLRGFGHTLLVNLPPIIKPWRRKIAAGWNAETVARMGRNWYWDESAREYGFTLSDDFFQVFLGRQTDDSDTEQRWSCFIPWASWRHVRFSLYGLDGECAWSQNEADCRRLRKAGLHPYESQRIAEKGVAKASFTFLDFDGESITAETYIEEREWRLGDKWCKWIGHLRSSRMSRSLDIRFNKETGRRKGSWKGGTVGHSIDLLPGELHEPAFRRYCAAHEMTFAATTPATNRGSERGD